MINITLPTKEVYQITFSFPDKHKPINEQVYTFAKLSRKIINPENSEDYVWETIDETIARCKNDVFRGRNYGDKFSKYIGRKVAFTKIVNNNFDKESRKCLWFIFLDKYGRG